MSLIFSIISFKGRFHYGDYPLLVSFILAGWAITTYFIGYHVYNQKSHYSLEAKLLPVTDEITKEYITINGTEEVTYKSSINKKQQELLTMFNKIIEEDKIFLKNNLRLDDIAREMNTNRTYISRMINEVYDCTFSDYINRKRIEHAQDLMRSEADLTQEQISEQSGFLHTSTFSRTFKQQAGITFREWQKKNSN